MMLWVHLFLLFAIPGRMISVSYLAITHIHISNISGFSNAVILVSTCPEKGVNSINCSNSYVCQVIRVGLVSIENRE